MTLRELPEAKHFPKPQNYQWDAPSDVLTRWAEIPQASLEDDANTITMSEVIGEDFWSGGGVTAKRVSAALRSIGKNDVLVKINSPGGDMFEGIAIYNLLCKHPARVTVEVMGIAASAASIIAMAGDEIRMGLGTFLMVHNAWGVVVGNQHDLRDAAALFEGFDSALADIYEARTEHDRKEIVRLMDAETFLDPKEAVAKGFADSIDNGLTLPEEDVQNSDRGLMARRQTEAALARAGYTRQARSEMMSEMGVNTAAPRDASRTGARDAAGFSAAAQRLIETLKT
jgi:ATP-dependent protease ClpP protease subunit